ncbi:DNA repair and recombination protein RAD54-like isoform X2 [Zophobas morio]|uniref:DNA repair and recombination protein RAD54-like isoform X2 n=1 Tax=Zophobas morio TaxID=2755281 RepID=UPI003083A261
MRRSSAPSQRGIKASALSLETCKNITLHYKEQESSPTADLDIELENVQTPTSPKWTEHELFIRTVLARPFKVPIANYQEGKRTCLGIRKPLIRRPLHDPNGENALVLYEPPPQLQPSNDPLLVHVVVDPLLSNVLRPHQREGVKFMYECITGLREASTTGCIMADDMVSKSIFLAITGLGKTLQCVSLVYTLLKQGPEGKPTIESCVIASPASLVKNWANEFQKWLGLRVSCLTVDGGSKAQIASKLQTFVSQSGNSLMRAGLLSPPFPHGPGSGRRRLYSLLVISYETLRTHGSVLASRPLGLIICDEGHRLKNMQNQTYQALDALQTKRRIIVSGTPIQNDLTEYYSLLNFVNPSLLGTPNEFRKNFANVIERGRDSLATEEEKLFGQEKLNDLAALANRFIIRRTSAINKKYLPSKVIQVVFCRLTEMQERIYQQFLKSKDILHLLKDSFKGGSTLTHILDLKKLCNHPVLIYKKLNEKKGAFENTREFLHKSFAADRFQPEFSGKLQVLDKMLALIRTTTSDKVVLVSNYTQTLDLFELMCKARQYKFVRLDGSLSIPKRQKLVDFFNDPQRPEFIFLLSSKAGGCGLNLVGANRIVLFDPDWNPATDLQAMARVWRDGQKKKCYIYRMVSTGTIEEKIFQRQSHKQALSTCVVDEGEDVERYFSAESLRDLFRLNVQTLSDTHEKFNCKRCVSGVAISLAAAKRAEDSEDQFDMSKWNHYSNFAKLDDIILRKSCGNTLRRHGQREQN